MLKFVSLEFGKFLVVGETVNSSMLFKLFINLLPVINFLKHLIYIWKITTTTLSQIQIENWPELPPILMFALLGLNSPNVPFGSVHFTAMLSKWVLNIICFTWFLEMFYRRKGNCLVYFTYNLGVIKSLNAWNLRMSLTKSYAFI